MLVQQTVRMRARMKVMLMAAAMIPTINLIIVVHEIIQQVSFGQCMYMYTCNWSLEAISHCKE